MTRRVTAFFALVALLVAAPASAAHAQAQDPGPDTIAPLDLPIDKPIRGRAVPQDPEQPPEPPQPPPVLQAARPPPPPPVGSDGDHIGIR